ncbi:MAG: hypothetical protein QNJ75_08055 [Acidimicrobiia bacterium]|nr:hypothetical protein [Acidimicrobiia bacterium]
MNRSISLRQWLPIAGSTALGGVIGWMVDRTVVWTTIGAIVGLAIAVMIVWFQVRPLVAAPVGVGAGVGAYLGGKIVSVLCEPAGCPAFEATAATTTGIGALVGIGLVVALATRSFEEYREAQERGAPPPTSSCAAGDDPPD